MVSVALSCQNYLLRLTNKMVCYMNGNFHPLRLASACSGQSLWRFRIKLIEIVILWVNYTIPFGFNLFWYFRVNIFYFWKLFVWRRITDEGSLPEMRIWSILLITSGLKWCIHLSRSPFLYSLWLMRHMCS